MADDPGSESAPRPRRRRRRGLAGAFDLSPSEPTESVEPVQPDPDQGFVDETRLPTFLHTPQDATARADDNILRPSLIVPHVVVSGDRPSASPGELGWLPMLDGRSDDPEICPFLRAVDDTDRLVAPVETPDPANRCAALHDPVPQSLATAGAGVPRLGPRQLSALPPWRRGHGRGTRSRGPARALGESGRAGFPAHPDHGRDRIAGIRAGARRVGARRRGTDSIAGAHRSTPWRRPRRPR